VGVVASAAGLAASFALDLPTGAAMVCTFGAALALAGLVYPFWRSNRAAAIGTTAAAVRWCLAAILAASAIQLVAAPRADQPLFDALEHAAPSFRSLYFSRTELAAFENASLYAERYRADSETINDLEKTSRTQGEALDDFTVSRMSSLLKSYGEMRKGEQFVMTEVRARARERNRWTWGLGLLMAAILMVLPWRQIVRWKLEPVTRGP
jgi:zinc/manganese transport system permease protein